MITNKNSKFILIKCPHCQQEVKETMANWHILKKCNENQINDYLYKGHLMVQP